MNRPTPKLIFHTLIFLGLLLPSIYSCKYQVAISPPWKKERPSQNQAIHFVEIDFLKQIDRAKLEGKPIFIDFYTKWCGPCRIMDRDVFTDGAAGAFFNDRFINLKINAEQGDGILLAKQFGVSAYPTLLFLNKHGKETKRVVGISTASKLIKFGKETCKSN